MIEKVKRHALLTIDEVARLVWETPVASEVVIRPAGIAARVNTAAGSIISGLLVRAAAANLAGRDVAKIGSTPTNAEGLDRGRRLRGHRPPARHLRPSG